MKFIFIICLSFFNYFPTNFTLKAAENINIKFEDMSIPISINQLSKLNLYKEDSTELIDWIKANGLERVFKLSQYLEFPIFRQDNFSKQIIRSWIGKKFLSEFSNIFIVPEDTNGILLFNTIESLLEKKKVVNSLDILKEIPIKEIEIDIDNLISIISTWKKALEDEQKFNKKLNKLNYEDLKISKNINLDNQVNFNYFNKKYNLKVSHRSNPLSLDLWIPEMNSNKDLIIFMPGLGGDISNFRWLGKGLSKKGWPVIFIDHIGSNSDAIKASIKGENPLPEGEDIFLYRLKDLDAVIKAHINGSFDLKNKSYILMGHSLGSLVSILYEGNLPRKSFSSRCEKAFNDFALTNLSKLIQCQLLELPIPEFKKSLNSKGIIGFSSFGNLIWSNRESNGVNVPVLFIGGTYDLITPLVNEQFRTFLASESNKLNRFLIIEGASHFSPIRVIQEISEEKIDNDVFKIQQNFIGINPFDFQEISLSIIVQFLKNLDRGKGLSIIKKANIRNINFHLLDKKELIEIYRN